VAEKRHEEELYCPFDTGTREWLLVCLASLHILLSEGIKLGALPSLGWIEPSLEHLGFLPRQFLLRHGPRYGTDIACVPLPFVAIELISKLEKSANFLEK
jgi:hypothetical protein